MRTEINKRMTAIIMILLMLLFAAIAGPIWIGNVIIFGAKDFYSRLRLLGRFFRNVKYDA